MESLPDSKILAHLITFCLGLIVGYYGHYLALKRDRRKEFNEISQPIREFLLNERINPSPHGTIGKVDADRLESVLHFWQRRAFRKSLNAYHQAKKDSLIQDPIYGSYSLGKIDAIIMHIEHLLRYTIRR